MSAPRTRPCSLVRIRAALVRQLHNQVTAQTHCRFAVSELPCFRQFGFRLSGCVRHEPEYELMSAIRTFPFGVLQPKPGISFHLHLFSAV